MPSAPRGAHPAAAGALSEVQERHHDPAWFSVGLPLAGTSPGYIVMRLSLPSVDPGSAAPALHRRGVFADLARHLSASDHRLLTPGRGSATGNDAFGQSQAVPLINTDVPSPGAPQPSRKYKPHNRTGRHRA